MSLRFRLALLFGVLVMLIQVAMSIFIYFSYKDLRHDAFYKRLEERAKITVKLLIDVKEIDQELLRIIDANTIHELYDEKILIINEKNEVIYSSIDNHKIQYTLQLLDKIRDSKKIEYNEREYDVIGMMCRYSDKDYIVFVSSLDKSGLAKVNNLRYILIVAILIGLALTSIAAYYYVKQMFKPIELLNTRISIINASNLQQKLEVIKTSDELGMLAENFNRMLDRLADSFEPQKGFVQNASHELRTPLANLTIELDNSLNKILSIAEYKEILRSIQEDINSLTGIINSLLFLSRYDKLKLETDATLIPIDELLFKSISEVKEYNSSAVVNVDFLEIPEREDFLQIICYPQILQTAFVNLIDNACKYSDLNIAQIVINITHYNIEISITNNGKTLTSEEIQRMYQPFFRGKNSVLKKGFGLGLSIVKRVIEAHKGFIKYSSVMENENAFTVILPRKT